MTNTELIPTPDGRVLEVLVSGPQNGLPVVFHNGTPSGTVPSVAMTAAAAAAGLRLVTYSRPGYGASTPQPGRRVVDAVADTTTLLDHLALTDFVTFGSSGGGPHALACAALLPVRCRAAATIAGVAPWGAQGLDFLAGMGPENVEEFGLAVQGQPALAPFLASAAAQLRQVTADDIADSLGGLLPDVDRASLTGEFAQWSAASFRKAVENGPAGWAEDDDAFVHDWGFALLDIVVPVTIWQGGEDLMVPFAHGQWLAAHIPGAQARLFAEHGHLSLSVDHLPHILAELSQAGS